MTASNPARSSLRRGLASGLALSLALPASVTLCPTSAAATTLGPAEPATSAHDAALAEARKLYDEGKAKFDTFDYDGAVDLWTKAYSKVPEDAADIRNSLVYNIATAQEKAFELDNDVQHLRQAKMLLESYIDNYKALYPRTDDTAAEVKKAEERIASLAERIEKAEQNDVRPPPEIEGEGSGTEAPPVPVDDPELLARNKKLAEEEAKTDRLLIASYVTLSVGGFLTLGGLSAVFGANQLEEEPMEDPMDPTAEPVVDDSTADNVRGGGYGVLALGLAGVVTGVVLLAVGRDRRKKAKAGTLVTGAPTFGRGFAGASLRVRF